MVTVDDRHLSLSNQRSKEWRKVST